MNAKIYTMKKLYFLLMTAVMIALVSVATGCTHCSENKELNPDPELSVAEHNRQCYEACKEDLLVITCLVEGFHPEPYFDGKVWTIGFGTITYPNGKKVRKNDAPISLAYAKECAYSHYDEQVWPYIDGCITRKLTPNQMIGTCSFIYNIGGPEFNTSRFVNAVNNGMSDFECAIRMNRYRSMTINGRRVLAPGLPKRHWIEGALYQGLLTPEDLLNLKPEKFYEDNSGMTISFYYKDRRGDYWTHDYSEEKIREFLKRNHSDTDNVRAYI